jgi:hypothetical protein
MQLSKHTEYDTASVDVYVSNVDSVDTLYIKGLTIPPNSAVKIITNGEKLIIPQDGSLRIVSDVPDSVSAVVSYVELS